MSITTTSLRRYAVRHSAVYLVTHAPLLGRITRTELAARYAGTLLGPAWAVLGPLLLLGLYAATYAMILKVRVGGLEPAQYVLFIFAGLVPFLDLLVGLAATVFGLGLIGAAIGAARKQPDSADPGPPPDAVRTPDS